MVQGEKQWCHNITYLPREGTSEGHFFLKHLLSIAVVSLDFLHIGTVLSLEETYSSTVHDEGLIVAPNYC